MKIKYCGSCKFSEPRLTYSDDGFGEMFEYKCTIKSSRGKVIGEFDWHEKVIPPKWCPLRKAVVK